MYQKYSKEETKKIKSMTKKGMSVEEIAKNMPGRSVDSIRYKLTNLGLYASKTKFSEEEVAEIRRHYPSSSWETILECLPNKTQGQITAKAASLRLRRKYDKRNNIVWPALGRNREAYGMTRDEWAVKAKKPPKDNSTFVHPSLKGL